MFTTYKTLDNVPALTNEQIKSAKTLKFSAADANKDGIDSQAEYGSMGFSFDEPVPTGDVFKLKLTDRGTYDVTDWVSGVADYDTFSLRICDNSGKVIAIDPTPTITSNYSFIHTDLYGFIAPYTGDYYIGAGWGAKYTPGFISLTIKEDIDTSRKSMSNSTPTGDLVINGKNSQGEILSLKNTIADKDGLGDFEYQWFRGDAEITDATAEKYTISGDDVGKKISVKVNYLDGDGYLETAFSSLSSTAAAKGASIGNDLLIGTNGSDKINGLAGNDTLVGGLGVDNLTGGLGADIFKFNASNDTGITAKTRDVITDFKHSEGDKIDLSGIDVNYGGQAFDQAFKFIGSKSFSGAAGEVRFDSKTAILYGNVNNDKVPDFAIQLNGVKSLIVDDFIL